MKSKLIIAGACCALTLLSIASFEASCGVCTRLVLPTACVADQATSVNAASEKCVDHSIGTFVNYVCGDRYSAALAVPEHRSGDSVLNAPGLPSKVSLSWSAGICNAVTFVDCIA